MSEYFHGGVHLDADFEPLRVGGLAPGVRRSR